MDPLVERELLLGNPDRANPQISPDGRWLGFVAPLDGVLNVWVAPADAPERAVAVTRDTGRGISQWTWSAAGDRVLFQQDLDGDENHQLFDVLPDGSDRRELTPRGVQALLAGVSPLRPGEVLILINDRDPTLHDPCVIALATGARRRLVENPGFVGWVTDARHEVRGGLQMLPDGGMRVFRTSEDGFEPAEQIPTEDALTTRPLAFDHAGEVLYWLESRGRDTAALVAEDARTGARTVLAEAPDADVSDMLVDPRTGRAQAAYTTWDVKRLQVLDPALAPHLQRLSAHRPGSLQVLSRSDDDARWTVAWSADDGPVAFGSYAADTGTVRDLFLARTRLAGRPLASRRPVVIRSRDGLDLVSYLTLPRWLDRGGRPERPLPMVLLVHGGPWARDEPGYEPQHQLLANRGYAVLSVNFRGSTGFGKAFVNAGNGEWAGRMHDDLLDAVEWAVREGVALRDKVAIMGGSYGGYATLVGLTFTPTVFACGVDVVGPSSLLTLLASIPPYWAPMKAQFHARLGNDETEEGRAFLWERSPLSRVDAIVRPLLIAQGANDPRVKQAEADQVVAAMRERGIPVRYALFPDEGHGFARPENRLAFYAEVEAFLAEHLGGRAQPAGDLAGSSLQLR